MNQAMEIAIKNGFDPGEEPYLIFCIHNNMKVLSEEIRELQKEDAQEPKYSYLNQVKINKNIGAYDILAGLLKMLDCSRVPDSKTHFDYKTHIVHKFLEHWFCVRCGYLEPNEVTSEERCEKCGGKLPM